MARVFSLSFVYKCAYHQILNSFDLLLVRIRTSFPKSGNCGFKLRACATSRWFAFISHLNHDWRSCPTAFVQTHRGKNPFDLVLAVSSAAVIDLPVAQEDSEVFDALAALRASGDAFSDLLDGVFDDLALLGNELELGARLLEESKRQAADQAARFKLYSRQKRWPGQN